jgi:hypothetical protein
MNDLIPVSLRGRLALKWDVSDRLDMVVKRTPPESATWQTEGYTTLVLERDKLGQWRASQDGIDTYGHGETAQTAAANYCRTVVEATDE